MLRPSWLKEAIAAGNEFHFLKQKIWLHNLINIASLGFVVCAFAGVMMLGALIPWWAYIPLASVVMGCLVYSLFVLVIHECSHSMYVLLKDREASKLLNHRIGAFIGDLLFTNYMEHWAREHTVHHLRPMEEVDRQDGLRFSGKLWLRKVALLVIPGFALMLNPSRQYGFSLRRTLIGTLFFGSIATIGVMTIHWSVGLAVVWGFNVTGACNLNKIAQEHGSNLIQMKDPYLRSRTYFYPGRWLFSPFCINYHFEHHANFNVPWYRLKAYHRRVLQLMPEEFQPYFLTQGLQQTVQQIAGTRALPPEAKIFGASDPSALAQGVV